MFSSCIFLIAAAPCSYANEGALLLFADQGHKDPLTTGGVEKPYSLVDPQPASPGAFPNYLAFLEAKLGFIPNFKSPSTYPIVTLLDTGLDNGNPVAPELDEFYVSGRKTQASRYIYSFSHSWRPTGVPSAADSFATQYNNAIGQGVRDSYCIVGANNQQHGTGVAMILAGHPRTDSAGNIVQDDFTPLPPGYTPTPNQSMDPVGNTSGHRRGQGVSPWGRIACGSMGSIIPNWPLGACAGQDPDVFRPEDAIRLVGEIHRRIYWVDNGPSNFVTSPWQTSTQFVPGNQTAIINHSVGYSPMQEVTQSPPGGTDTGFGKFIYDDIARTFDRLTRDGRPRTWFTGDAGRCQSLFVVAAGGDLKVVDETTKRQEDSMWSPALAKNVLTAGASESYNVYAGEPQADSDDSNGVSGQNIWLGTTSSKAGSPRYIDSRIKPDIVAPTAGAWTRSIGVTTVTPQHPAIYSTGSGTSGAAPLVSGLAQILWPFLKEQYQLSNPSPALLKAYIINTAQMLHGARTGPYNPSNSTANEVAPIPNPYQGFGRANVEMALDRADRFLVNQTHTLLSPGSSFAQDRATFKCRVFDSTRPVRVTLAWTDAVSAATTARWQELVNNLDLMVTVKQPYQPTRTYIGNNFATSGDLRFSTALLNGPEPTTQDTWLFTGLGPSPVDIAVSQAAAFDSANNVECVFLPEGLPLGTEITISARARNIAQDALDPYGSSTGPGGAKRQDFALVGYNIREIASTRAEGWELVD